MGLKTVNWDRVVALTMAKVGLDFADEEKVNIGALINSAAQYIFDESRYHPRFLVLEPRTALAGYIEPIEDSFNLSGAGTSSLDGLYVRNGVSADGNPAYTLFDSDGTTAVYSVFSKTNTEWVITEGVVDGAGAILYTVTSTATTPPELGWVVTTGTSPAPRVQALAEIDEIISYWDGVKWAGANPSQEYGYPDQNGFRLTTDFTGTIYVAFKKVLPTEYGDGNQGTTSDFPSEWLNYCAYSAAREWSGSQRNQDAYNPVSLRDVDKREAQVLIKANRQGAFDTIANIWRTRFAADRTITSGSRGRAI